VVGRPYVQNYGRIELGDDVLVRSAPVRTHLVARTGGAIAVGDGVEIGHGAGLAAHARIEIGDGTSIGPLALVLDSNFHKVGSWRGTTAEGRPIHVGRDVRIGARAVVMPGAWIGDGAVVAPASVVVGRVEPGQTVSGAPACASRRRPGRGDVPARVAAVVQEVFGLPVAPPATAAPRQVPGWNLLGGLRLLATLEDEFGVALPDRLVSGAARLQEVVDAVQAATGTRG
jgi:acetyltransferase-like isoleucine patch superfamily enzyme/acyl carrier protein